MQDKAKSDKLSNFLCAWWILTVNNQIALLDISQRCVDLLHLVLMFHTDYAYKLLNYCVWFLIEHLN